MPDTDLNFASIEHLAALVRDKQISPLELMDHTLARINELNPTLNALVQLDAETARSEAQAQTERLAAGQDLGPLGGIPAGIKDLENAKGFITTQGSPLYANNPPATFDDVHIERLKAAGAIVVGKTNTPEFGLVPFTDNEVFGVTRNPWNLERTPGGSSGGSSAAIASGMLALATASDGGGSIRIPACYTGLFGHKPSFGRVPIAPRRHDAWMDTSVFGPLTRTVADAALLMDVISGPDDRDRNTLPAEDRSYRQRLQDPLPPLRIAFNRTLGVTRLQTDVEREVETAVAVFRELGHDVEENTDAIPETGRFWNDVASWNNVATSWDDYTSRHDEYGELAVQMLDHGLGLDAERMGKFLDLRQQITNWTARLFANYDLLLTPTLPTEAFAAQGPVPRTLYGEKFVPIALTYPFNFSGHPAANVRAGMTDAGLPCGLQIVGPRFRDDRVLQASLAYEEARPWDTWPRL
ncbi:MAG: aspartyl-tRNA(Asn)/glutamyl-tRNA(Gln) amidotransferase subunit A [Chloroflexi bacterium]|nr:MAG: aspartyl-tRNA(Asn)/glutamyl-tRNA(Gln) amidotransferase subunit A [Chloroflexota bacterium]